MSGKKKGGAYERKMAKAFSDWWSGGERDDIFWRTASSGGRAGNRNRRGKTTFGQYGDLQATDPIGQPLIDLCTIEIKRGYAKAVIGDALDRKPTKHPRPWEKIIMQAIKDCELSPAPYWMAIVRRDARFAMIYFPSGLYQKLRVAGARLQKARPWVRIRPLVPNQTIYGTTLDEFFRYVKPKHIISVTKELDE